MRWLTADEEEVLRTDFRDNDREVQRSAWMYLAGLMAVLGLIVVPDSRPLLTMVTGNAGYNAFAFLALAVFNVMFTCYLLYRSLSIHETMQLLILFSRPNSGMLNWEAWRRSSQSATRPVRPFYFAILLALPLVVSITILLGLHRVLWTTNLLDARWTPLWTAWWAVLALHALPFWFGWHCMGPTPRRWEGIASLRGLEPSRFDVPGDAEMAEWPVDVVALPDGTVMIANLIPADLSLLSRPPFLKHYSHGRFTLTRESLRLIERLGGRPQLLAGLRTTLGQADTVDLRFGNT